MAKSIKANTKLIRCSKCNYKHTKELRVLLRGFYVCPKCHEAVYKHDINSLINQD